MLKITENGGKTDLRFSPWQGQLEPPAHLLCQVPLHGSLALLFRTSLGQTFLPRENWIHMLEIIPVKPSSSSSGYIMVELQGELEFDSDQKGIVRQIGIMAQAHQGGGHPAADHRPPPAHWKASRPQEATAGA